MTRYNASGCARFYETIKPHYPTQDGVGALAIVGFVAVLSKNISGFLGADFSVVLNALSRIAAGLVLFDGHRYRPWLRYPDMPVRRAPLVGAGAELYAPGGLRLCHLESWNCP